MNFIKYGKYIAAGVSTLSFAQHVLLPVKSESSQARAPPEPSTPAAATPPVNRVTPHEDWITSHASDLLTFTSRLQAPSPGETPRVGPIMLLAGPTSEDLAGEIAARMNMPLSEVQLSSFADGETSVLLKDNPRGKDVFIIHSTTPPANETLMQLLLCVSALRRAHAKRVTVVAPYLAYKRDVGGVTASSFGAHTQALLADAREQTAAHTKSIPISAADVAIMLEAMGTDRLISVDLAPFGSVTPEGFFSPQTPVEIIRSTPLAVQQLLHRKLVNPVIVATNEANIPMARDVVTGLLRAGISQAALCITVDNSASRGFDRYFASTPISAEARPKAHRDPMKVDLLIPPAGAGMSGDNTSDVAVVGSIEGRDVVIIDDLIDTAGTMASRVALLKQQGARKIYVYATHGLFTGEALSRIAAMPVQEVMITNSIPLRKEVSLMQLHKISEISIAPLLAEAISRAHADESLHALKVYDDDNEQSRYRGQDPLADDGEQK